VTYSELDEQVNDIASALIHIGFTNIDSPLASRPRVSIYADTSLRWQLMAQTFSRLGHVITTAYTTLGEEGLLRSLVEPDVEFVFCGEDQVEMVSKVVARAEKVKWVIFDADESRVDKVSSLNKVEADIQASIDTIRKVVEARGGQLLRFPDLCDIGHSNPTPPEQMGPKPTEDDVYTIMYTSGSTGDPKGVLLTHKNMIASRESYCHAKAERNSGRCMRSLERRFLPKDRPVTRFPSTLTYS
jgi:long-chain acyl-CoA synthetase